jgi:hypothetical protein
MNDFLMNIITIQEINKQIYTSDCENYCNDPNEITKTLFINDINVIKNKLLDIKNILES